MTEQEQLKVIDRAKIHAREVVSTLPGFLKAQVVEDAIYCAYLEGAGIRTK